MAITHKIFTLKEQESGDAELIRASTWAAEHDFAGGEITDDVTMTGDLDLTGDLDITGDISSRDGYGGYGLIKTKQELVTTTAAATALTANDFIPDGSVPLAISTYVQTAITVASLTGYTVGDGSDPDRWGAVTGHIVGTKTNNASWTATTIQAFTSAQAITLTAAGANFPAGGKIRVSMTYITGGEPTS